MSEAQDFILRIARALGESESVKQKYANNLAEYGYNTVDDLRLLMDEELDITLELSVQTIIEIKKKLQAPH